MLLSWALSSLVLSGAASSFAAFGLSFWVSARAGSLALSGSKSLLSKLKESKSISSSSALAFSSAFALAFSLFKASFSAFVPLSLSACAAAASSIRIRAIKSVGKKGLCRTCLLSSFALAPLLI